MDIHLIKDNELFGIGQANEVAEVYNQIQQHNVITIGRIMVRTERKDWLQDEFTLAFIENGEAILGKLAYITSYREISTPTVTIAEKCTVITRNPGEQVKRTEASITLEPLK
jgi:hypothetical protein